MFKGKKLSILGDSISTYKGVSDDISANATLGSNPYFYRLPFPLEKTYWSLLIRSLELTLCVNNSWSGGNLSGSDNPISGVQRAQNLARDDGSEPDIVIVFMGLNDLGRGVSPSTFAEDYTKTLLTITSNFPEASVCCVNIPDRDAILKSRAEEFNRKINAAVSAAGKKVFVADLFSSRLNNDFYYLNTVDGIHPDEDGMRIIAELIEDVLRKNCI